MSDVLYMPKSSIKQEKRFVLCWSCVGFRFQSTLRFIGI